MTTSTATPGSTPPSGTPPSPPPSPHPPANPPANNQSSGIVISFLASIVGIIIGGIMYFLKWKFELSSTQTLSLWVIVLTTILSLRLYFRVLFIDSLVTSLKKDFFRYSLLLIIPLSAMTGIKWSFFDFSEFTGAIFMTVYCSLFFIFSLITISGLENNIPKQTKIDNYVSIGVDFFTTCFWAYYIYYITIHPDDRMISDGLQLMLMVFCMVITWEFRSLYFVPLISKIEISINELKK